MFRVVWKYDSSIVGSVLDLLTPAVPSAPPQMAAMLIDLLPLGAPQRVFTRSVAGLRAWALAPTPFASTAPPADLAAYHHVFFATLSAAEEAARRISSVPGVLDVDIEARPIPCFIHVDRHGQAAAPFPAPPAAGTPDFHGRQGHLGAAPGGVSTAVAWTVNGGRGEGITVIDIEYGWNFDHEDLRAGSTGVIYGPVGKDDHGTAVLGVVSSDDNGFGVVGVAPTCVVAAASADWDGNKWNAADAIHESARRLNPGDVIVLEMHGPGPEAAPDWPVSQIGLIAIEYWDDNFDAILDACRNGIVVVGAAGNGGKNLDSPKYKRRFDRSFRDSQAILVGAGASSLDPLPRSRMSFSNYGSRLDVQGWGEDVVTCGGRSEVFYHDLFDGGSPDRCYTRTFGGTSGATPIVAGVVACIQGALIAAGRGPLSPTAMRALLVETGTPQGGNAATEPIGPLPDLESALHRLGLV